MTDHIPLKICTCGTFDGLHEGHKELIKRIGNWGKLYVIIIPFQRKKENSGYFPSKSDRQRRRELLFFGQIENRNLIEEVYIDSYSDGFNSLLAIRPDIFCFGYDQSKEWEQKIIQFANEHSLPTTFIRLATANGNGIHSAMLRRQKAGKHS